MQMFSYTLFDQASYVFTPGDWTQVNAAQQADRTVHGISLLNAAIEMNMKANG